MHVKNKDGVLVMKQKLSLAQQNNRLTVDEGVETTTGEQDGNRLRLLANKPAKSRFDVKQEAEEPQVEEAKETRRQRKRRSRWAADNEEKIVVPGMSTNVPSKLNPLQQKIYVLQLQVEDCTRRLLPG